MKFLIYGHQGWLGAQVVSLIKQGYDVSLGDARLDEEANLEKEILKHNPDRVISLAGRTLGEEVGSVANLDEADEILDNVRDNLYGPLTLAILCNKLNIHLTHVGTGSIFDDSEGQASFTESCKPNFFGSQYSIVKGFTDRLIQQFGSNTLNVRMRMPITSIPNSYNFITKLTRSQRVHSIENSVTVLPDLLPVMIDMSKRKTTGTVNLTNPGTITHNEILEMYREIVDPTFTWSNSLTEVPGTTRSNCSLNTDRLEAMYPQVMPIKDAIRKVLEKMKEVIFPYDPQSVLITGGCGFIGSNTMSHLANKYPHIEFVNIDKMDYCSSEEYVMIKDRSKYTFYKGDINDTVLVREIFNKHKIDTVIHFAAQSHVDNSFGNSVTFTYDNILGTHNLLESVRAYGKIRKFIHISTDEVYGEVSDDNLGCDEESSLLNPTNPYAASKASAEFIVRSYIHSFKLPIVITRGNNVYGQCQYPEKVIPRFIMQLLNNEKCTLHGRGESKRNFISVEDTARAIETVLLHGTIGEIYNIGTNNEYTVHQIAEKLIQKLKPNDNVDDWINYVKDRDFNDRRYSVKATKLLRLGWKEQIRFEQGIDDTIDWYRNNGGMFNWK